MCACIPTLSSPLDSSDCKKKDVKIIKVATNDSNTKVYLHSLCRRKLGVEHVAFDVRINTMHILSLWIYS